jgi:hypothetical protein
MIFQDADNFHHCIGIISSLGEIFGPQAICLEFHIPAITTDQGTAKQAGGFAKG